ncbi:cation:proton antiporter [Methanothermococcus okinawensis]|uniref:Sodium/hydrogen exchanger n=1 Tax=Methanothermococcus okinawensis (strain DSM 14208 / JCM 11175 / IH1) TaxID=647113 RepID=F8AN71_METOI|nr:sodium:proton antiporter [Methanothermococcus okinawensis]AEH06987.1 sodium/hydrogen exchanger [Methanothermococcus okinawensis IH1]
MELAIIIGYISLLLISGSIIAKIGEKLNIPDIPLLLIYGLIVGPFLGIISTGYAQDIFGYVATMGLIIILLGGAFEMRWIVLKKVLKTVLKLDTIALIGTLGVSGLIFNMIFKIPYFNPIGYLYGAITCATDPATLMPIFSKSDINPEVAITLEAESVFNDPLGIVATTIILAMMGLAKAVNPILNFLSLAVGGIILGFIGGKIFEKTILKWDFKEYVAPLIIGMAMALWYFGDVIFPYIAGYEISGFMAVAIMGLYLGNTLTKYPEQSKNVENIVGFCGDLSTLIRILIFVFLGASISLSILTNYWFVGLVCALGSIFIARPLGVLIATSLPPSNPLKERLYFALEGPRGVVPAALSATVSAEIMKNPHIIPQEILKYMPAQEIAGSILVATFMTILLSVVTEASWAETLAKKLFKE